MIKKELIERLEALRDKLGEDNCPDISPEAAKNSQAAMDISKANKATNEAYEALNTLIEEVMYE